MRKHRLYLRKAKKYSLIGYKAVTSPKAKSIYRRGGLIAKGYSKGVMKVLGTPEELMRRAY